MKIISISFLLIITILNSSCFSIVANKIGIKDLSPKVTKLSIPNKEVYFLGMAHLGKKEFYENTKQILADFQNKGFIIYVESVSNLDSTKRIIDTTFLKKLRKITGLDLTVKYSQNPNPIFKKFTKKYNLVDQPRYEVLGVKNYSRVDYDYMDLVNLYEKKYLTIQLDSCDIKTGLKEEYKCNVDLQKRDVFAKEIINNARNKLVAKTIINSDDKKIVIVYGKSHLDGIQQKVTQLINKN